MSLYIISCEIITVLVILNLYVRIEVLGCFYLGLEFVERGAGLWGLIAKALIDDPRLVVRYAE